MHKRCAEDSTKKLAEQAKKLSHLQQLSTDRAATIKELEDKLGDQEIQVKNANFQLKRVEQESAKKNEEIALLKDYVYGVDGRAKDLHMHKFLGNALPG